MFLSSKQYSNQTIKDEIDWWNQIMNAQVNRTAVENLVNECIDLLSQMSVSISSLQGFISQLILMNPSDPQIINLNATVSKITSFVDELKMKLNIESGSIIRDAYSDKNLAFGLIMFYELVQHLYDINSRVANKPDIGGTNLPSELKMSFEYISRVADIAKSIFDDVQNRHMFNSRIVGNTIDDLLKISQKQNVDNILKLNLDAINKLNELIVLPEDTFSDLFIEYLNRKIEIEQQIVDLEREYSNITKIKMPLEKILKKLKSDNKLIIDVNTRKIVHKQFIQGLIEKQMRSGRQIDLSEIAKELGISRKIMLPIVMSYTNKYLTNLIENIDSTLYSL